MRTPEPKVGGKMHALSFGIGGVMVMYSREVTRVTPTGIVVLGGASDRSEIRVRLQFDGRYSQGRIHHETWVPDGHPLLETARRQEESRSAVREVRSRADAWSRSKTDLGAIDALIASLEDLRGKVAENDG